MSVVGVKAALKAWLEEIPDLGTLKTSALDSDGIPREARGARLWYLGIPGGSDEAAQFGNPNQVVVIRNYDCVLEGWHGFSGTRDITEEWETLHERIIQQLQATNMPPCRIGVQKVRQLGNLAWDGLDVRIIREDSSLYRAHHARITFTLQVTESYLK